MDAECENLPHVILTSDAYWDPDVADHDAPFTAITALEAHEPQVNIQVHMTCQLDTCLFQDEIRPTLQVIRHQTTLSNRYYSAHSKYFLKAPWYTIE